MKLLILFGLAAAAANAQLVEFVTENFPTPSCHASTIVELDHDRLMTAWFGGTREGAPDVAIWSSRRSLEGWSPAKELVREPEIATYNPVLFQAPGGLLWLYYKFGPSPGLWSAGRLSSVDEGHNFTPPEHLPAGLYGPIRTKPLVLKNGTILSGTSVESYESWACWIERSTDRGRTWTRIGPIAAPKSLAQSPAKNGSPYGIIQPSLLEMGGRHIRLYARSTQEIGHICQSDSFDDGLTWSEVKATALPNPNSGIDAVRLPDGRIVMVYNNTTTGRTPLNLAITKDGVEWRKLYDLETEPGEYSYPAMVLARNGDLLITYTWNRRKIRFVRFPEGKIPLP
jgi:predicted neuraminidase